MDLTIPLHHLFYLESQRRDLLDVREGVLHYPTAAARRRLARERKRLTQIIQDNPWLSDIVVGFDSGEEETFETPENVLKMVDEMLKEKLYRVSASEYLEANFHLLNMFYLCQAVVEERKKKP